MSAGVETRIPEYVLPAACRWAWPIVPLGTTPEPCGMTGQMLPADCRFCLVSIAIRVVRR